MDPKIAQILFPEGIYVLEDKKETESETRVEGNSQSRVLCVFDNNSEEKPNEEEILLAEKILESIKIPNGDYCWTHQLSILSEKNFLKEITLLFMHTDGPHSEKYPLHDWSEEAGVQIFRTYALSQLKVDKDKKRELWSAISGFRVQ